MISTPVALVTGGSRGLGRELVVALLADGWTVVTDGRDADRLVALAGELGSPALTTIVGDVVDDAHRAELAAAIDRLGRLDLLVNNASTLGPTPMAELAAADLDGLRAAFEVNAVAPLALVQRLLPLLRDCGGVVVDVSSDAAVEGYATWGVYGATKAALDQLSAVLAAEEPSIRVLAVDPGDMRTDLHQAAFAGEDISDRPPPSASVPDLLRLIAEAPSGRHRVNQVAEEVTRS